MTTLEESRAQIDRIDRELTRLIKERMQTAGDIAAYKKEHGLPVLDASRERSKLRQIAGMTDEPYRDDILQLYGVILELSKSFQSRILGTDDSLVQKIRKAIEETPQLFLPTRPWPARGLKDPTPRSPATAWSAMRTSCIFPASMQCFPQWKKDCAAMG